MPDKKERAAQLLSASKGLAQATGYQPEPSTDDPDPIGEQPKAAPVRQPVAEVPQLHETDSFQAEKAARPIAYGFSVPAPAAESDKHVMVGARVPEPMRAAIRTACAIYGMDVQTFCQKAFERELRRLARQG